MRAQIVAVTPLALILLAAARPALAQQAPIVATPPLVNPAPDPTPPPEVGLAAMQVALGVALTFGVGIGAVFLSEKVKNSDPVAWVGIFGAPLVGSLAICALGRTSDFYDGHCMGAVTGGYLGALVLAVPGWYVGSSFDSPNAWFAFDGIVGVVVGFVVGAAVGATVGWHLSKHRRAAAVSLDAGPPAPPPTALAAWNDLRARPTEGRSGVAVGVPLLSLRF